MLESIARSFGYIYGREKHVRINTISQSPTATTAGKGIKDIENMMDFADKMSPLGNAVAEDCANYCVMMFSDFTRKVTMQNLFHDGGFSSMGMSLRAMNQYAKDRLLMRTRTVRLSTDNPHLSDPRLILHDRH